MISSDTKNKLTLILTRAAAFNPQLFDELLRHGCSIQAYGFEALDESSIRTRQNLDYKLLTHEQLNTQLLEDHKRASVPNLILFQDELAEKIQIYTHSGVTDFKIVRFCPFSFLYGFKYLNPAYQQYAGLSFGAIEIFEKRCFKPGEEPPKYGSVLNTFPAILNAANKSDSLIFNQQYSSSSVELRALKLIQQSLTQKAMFLPDYLDIAVYRAGSDSFAEAVWACRQAAKLAPDNILLKLLETWISLSVRDIKTLEQLKIELTKKYVTRSPEAAFLLAEIASAQGFAKESNKILDEIYKKLPTYPIVCQRLARSAILEKNFDSAETQLNKLLGFDPFNPMALLDLSQLKIRSKQFELAFKLVEAALLSPVCENRAFLQKAAILRHRGDKAGSINCLEAFVENEQKDSSHLSNARRLQVLNEVKQEIDFLKTNKT